MNHDPDPVVDALEHGRSDFVREVRAYIESASRRIRIANATGCVQVIREIGCPDIYLLVSLNQGDPK
jgi:hypothetical protein